MDEMTEKQEEATRIIEAIGTTTLKEETYKIIDSQGNEVLADVMVRFFSNLFTSECPKCKIGRVRYIGDDWTGHTWISVYKCKNCKSEFI